MKKLLIIFFLSLLGTCPGWGDEIGDTLKDMGNSQIRDNARKMVQAGIPRDEALNLTRSMLQNQFRATYIIGIQNMLMKTKNANLPVEPLMNKAFEGMAKNMPDQMVFQAMQKTHSRHSFAHQKAQAISSNATDRNRLGQEIDKCMRAGLEKTDVDQIMAQLQTRARHMSQNSAVELGLHSFSAARTMARLGVPSSKATDVINNALQNQYTARQMMQVRNNFKTQSKHTSPNQLANQYAHGIDNGKKPDELGSPQNGTRTHGSSTSGSSGGSGPGGASGGSGENSGGSSGSNEGSSGNSGDAGNSSGGAGGSDAGSGGSSGGSDGGGGGTGGHSGKN